MLFESQFEECIAFDNLKSFFPPTLENAFEPFEALYGEPLRTGTLNFQSQLQSLGYLDDEEVLGDDLNARYAVFLQDRLDGGKLIFVSDGLRTQSGNAEQGGIEFFLELPSSTCNGAVPDWPLQVLSLAWLILSGSKSKNLRNGTVFHNETPLAGEGKNALRTFLCEHDQEAVQQLSPQGPFNFLRLHPIGDEDAKLLEFFSGKQMLSVLKLRGQATKRLISAERAQIEPSPQSFVHAA